MKCSALLALLLLNLTTAFGQFLSSSVVNTSGNSHTQGLYSIDWSLGELALVETMRSSDGKFLVTHGFLQPELAAYHPGNNFSNDELRIFPNPTLGKIAIGFSTGQQGTLIIQLFDGSGRLMISQKAMSYGSSFTEVMDLTVLASGTYMLRVQLEPTMGSVPKKGSYKIIKL